MSRSFAIIALIARFGNQALGAPPVVDPDAARLVRIEQLEAQVEALEAAREQTWLTDARHAAIEELLTDMLADADTRASLLDSGVSAGWDDGFFIGTSDGAFRLGLAG